MIDVARKGLLRHCPLGANWLSRELGHWLGAYDTKALGTQPSIDPIPDAKKVKRFTRGSLLPAAMKRAGGLSVLDSGNGAPEHSGGGALWDWPMNRVWALSIDVVETST